MTNVPATLEVAQPTASPAELVSAAAAGQPALIRIARTNMLRAISRECFAVDRDALPAPRAVRFDPHTHAAQLDFDTPAEAAAWAERLGGLRSARNWAMVGATGYHAIVDWRGVRVDLVSVVPAASEWPPAAAAKPAPIATHYETGGWGGVPGQCGVECACGITFDGFDTIGEAAEHLKRHIASEVAGPPAAAAEQTAAVPA